MATGRNNKLVGQTGEYLVAAELSRMNLIATTFTGNVPHYDIIASDNRGRHVAIQVKASRGDSWQVSDMSKFCDIRLNIRRKTQIAGKKKSCPIRQLVCIFVRLDGQRQDRFFICTWKQWRNLLVSHHKRYLRRHHGHRPKKWKSLHTAIRVKDLKRFEDRWGTVKSNLH